MSTPQEHQRHDATPEPEPLTAYCRDCGSTRIWMQEMTYFRQEVTFLERLPDEAGRPMYEIDYGPCYDYVYESTEDITDANGTVLAYVCRECESEHALADLLIVENTNELVQIPEERRPNHYGK